MPKHPSKKSMIRAARRIFQDEGKIEIDDGAKVSRAKRNEENLQA